MADKAMDTAVTAWQNAQFLKRHCDIAHNMHDYMSAYIAAYDFEHEPIAGSEWEREAVEDAVFDRAFA